MSSPANILDSGSAQKEVLLIYPGKFRAPDPQVPLSLLHLAPPLQLAGYKVRIFDMRVEDIRQLYVGSPVYAGISCMSGLQIRYSLEAARKVRAQNPAVPLVWGGVHPSLLPQQTAANTYVDVAVRGEGETVVAKLADALAAGLPLKSVKGLTFKADGEVRCTPDAELVDLDQIPVELPYELLQLDKYPSIKAGRIHIQTSRGCPHRCGFCYNILFNRQAWRGKTAARVVDEIAALMKRVPQAKIIDPIDDNFSSTKNGSKTSATES